MKQLTLFGEVEKQEVWVEKKAPVFPLKVSLVQKLMSTQEMTVPINYIQIKYTIK